MTVRHARRRGPRPAARRRGFTLIEVLLVAGILVMLAAIVVPNLLGADEQAKIRAAKANVQSLSKMFDQYKFTYDQDYPSGDGFNILYTGGGIQNYKPLIENPRPLDPWNQPYNYAYPGTHNQALGKPDVWSNGPDKQPNTADDIGNWTVR